MSASSGIGISPQLADQFSSAVDSTNARFIKVSIQNETLVPDLTIPPEKTFQEDLEKLQELLEDDIPAYVLAKLDDPPSDWLAIFYVPDTAKVRDKMLYASTRHSLLKSLSSTHFPDSLFATSKSDLTPSAYAAHLRHLAAPKPLTAREKEQEAIKAAERESVAGYEGSRGRVNHIGTGVGYKWGEGVEEKLRELGEGEGEGLVVLTIDAATETIQLRSSSQVSADQLGRSLPSSEPCYAFFAWPHTHTTPPRREIIFIYSCPSTSPIQHRMLYSSGSSPLFNTLKSSPLFSSSSTLNQRKVETSDPSELNEAYLKLELGLGGGESRQGLGGGGPGAEGGVSRGGGFARPKGPARKR